MIFAKQIKDIHAISSTDHDIIRTIEWYVDKCLRHEEIETSFQIILLHSEKFAIDINTKVWYISGRLMGWSLSRLFVCRIVVVFDLAVNCAWYMM